MASMNSSVLPGNHWFIKTIGTQSASNGQWPPCASSPLSWTFVFNALAVIVQPNPRSLAFHRRAGFEQVGVFARAGYKHGRWWDVAWLQKRLREGEPAPMPWT